MPVSSFELCPPDAPPVAGRTPRDVIFTFSYVSWEAARLRGMNFAQDRLLQTLLVHPGVRRLLVAEPFRSLPARLVRRLVRSGPTVAPPGGRATLHSPLRLRRSDPVRIESIERAYRAYDRQLQRASRRAGLREPAIITMHPLIAGYAPLEWAESVTFYATDDWAAHPAHRRWWPAYETAYERVRGAGHRLCAVSEPIIDRVGPTGPCALVPNGIEPSEWTRLEDPPSWFAELPQPRILYLGTLDERLDVRILERLSDAFPHGTIALVGRLAAPRHLAALQGRRNVHVRDRVPRDGVPSLVAGADVSVIPHARTQLTSAMSPLKLYEYLAAGRPVVAVDLPPLRGVDGRVFLVGEEEDFAEATRAALARGPAPEAERELFVEQHSWQRRHERVLDLALSRSV